MSNTPRIIHDNMKFAENMLKFKVDQSDIRQYFSDQGHDIETVDKIILKKLVDEYSK